MKKFILVLMLSVFVSIFAISSVMADQYLNATVAQNVNVVISPLTLYFNNVLPGTTNNATNGPIVFNATGSNVNAIITVQSVTGGVFDTGLKLDGVSATGKTFNLNCVISSGICAYSPVFSYPTLFVPNGAPAGAKSGVIVYTITGTAP